MFMQYSKNQKLKCPIFETKKDFTKIPTDLNSMYIHTELVKIW